MEKIVCVFGSSHPRENEEAYAVAYEVGKLLATRGLIVANGGYSGIMEASARGAKSAAGKTIGVTIRSSAGRTANKWIDTVIEKDSLVERLATLVSLGDAYVILQGGTGTLLELAAVWEFTNKQLMPPKPIIAVGDFWNDVISTLRHQLFAEGSSRAADAVVSVQTPQQCVEHLRTILPA